MFDVPTHSPGQHNLLKISSLSHEIINRILVTDPDDILFDSRAFIQILRGIVGCCPDNFYPSVIGLSIGIGADEGGQE